MNLAPTTSKFSPMPLGWLGAIIRPPEIAHDMAAYASPSESGHPYVRCQMSTMRLLLRCPRLNPNSLNLSCSHDPQVRFYLCPTLMAMTMTAPES